MSEESKVLPPEAQAGGMTTGEWGTKVYGEMGQQSAIPGTNVLKINGGSEGEMPIPPQMIPSEGGMPALLSAETMTPVVLTIASNQIPKLLRKSLKLKKSKGGSAAASVAVPAMLVIANQVVGKRLGRKTHKSRGGRKQRRTHRR